jgi:hypothetical protein
LKMYREAVVSAINLAKLLPFPSGTLTDDTVYGAVHVLLTMETLNESITTYFVIKQ